jgi:hypothetical protein
VTTATAEPIQDSDFEAAVLGAILAGEPIPAELKPDHFYRREYGVIFGTCLAVAAEGNPVDELCVTRRLREKGNLRAVGGAVSVSALTNSLPAPANVNYYAGRVIEDSRKREAQELGARLQRGDAVEAVLPKLQTLAAGSPGESAPAQPSWPTLASEARYGLAGEILAAIEPHTEADPVAILAQFLAFYGSCVGRAPYFMVESDRHGVNESMVLIGRTSRARKGTALGHVRRLFEAADSTWTGKCIANGLSSGEGLIWAVRDPITKLVTEKDGTTRDVPVDEGVLDKRLLVIESEYASVLKVMSRKGNTLSPVIRDAWDGHSLRSLVKNFPARASDPHISILGHITKTELKSLLTETEVANGYGNRVLWLCVRRSKLLPRGRISRPFYPFFVRSYPTVNAQTWSAGG